MSNNPFRNKIVSQPPAQPTQRPISTNPFLDFNEVSNMSSSNNTPNGAHAISVDNTADIFVSVGFYHVASQAY